MLSYSVASHYTTSFGERYFFSLCPLDGKKESSPLLHSFCKT
jgi:hypothetical protein